MNAHTFIDAIKETVIEDSIKSIKSNLENPPGKKPDNKIVELSQWFNSANANDQSLILKLIRESVEMSIFGFLCVLDGVRAIENSEEKGVLKLFYEDGSQSVLLNDPNNDYLHDLLL